MRSIVKRPGWVLALGLALSIGAVWPASRFSLDTHPVALLPEESPAAADYRVFVERFGGLEKVFVVVRSLDATRTDVEARLVEASERLAVELDGRPGIADARSGVTEDDLEFLRHYVVPRAPLLLGDDWKSTLEARMSPAALERRVARIRSQVAAPLASLDSWKLAADPLGFADELPAFRMRSSDLPIDPFTGAFVARDGGAALVLVTPTETEIDPTAGRELAAEFESAFATVQADSDLPLEFLATGGPLYAAEDETLIRRDVQRSMIGSSIGCLLLLVGAFGGLRLPLAVLASVFGGLVWTVAVLALSIGAVTAASLGFSAVLIGLGVDYGIHGAARFRQRRTLDESPRSSMAAALRASGAGIVTSALTTAGAFAVLAVAHSRPLRELGVLVAVGVLCILGSSLVVGAPLALLSVRGTRREGWLWRWLGRSVDWASGWARRRAAVALGLLVVGSAIAAWGVTRLALDPDVRTFRSLDHTAFEAESALLEDFGVGAQTATAVVSDVDLPTTLVRAARVRELIRASAGEDVDVSSPTDWLSGREASAERLGELGALPWAATADRLEEELAAAGLRVDFFARGLEALRSLADGRDPGAPPESAWPGWLRQLVHHDDEGFAAAIRIRAPESQWPAGPPEALVERIRTETRGHVASASLVGSELRDLAGVDLRALGGLALGVVVIVVLISFRGSVLHAALALTPVLLGALWSLGLWGALGRPLDLATLAVLPIVLGIGLDDGLHVLHAYRASPSAGLTAAVREVGHPILLTTATTCVAFGSLVSTSVPGLRNAGLLVSLGVVGCLLATMVVLPSLDAVLGRKGSA